MEQIYVFLDPEVQTLLADNEIDLVQELRAQGLQVEGKRAGDPGATGEGKERDLVLVILASGAAFAAVSFGISRVIDAIGRNKRAIVEERELAPITDDNGKIVKGADGEPRLYWRTKHRIVEPASPQPDRSKVDISAGGERGLRISLGAGG